MSQAFDFDLFLSFNQSNNLINKINISNNDTQLEVNKEPLSLNQESFDGKGKGEEEKTNVELIQWLDPNEKDNNSFYDVEIEDTDKDFEVDQINDRLFGLKLNTENWIFKEGEKEEEKGEEEIEILPNQDQASLLHCSEIHYDHIQIPNIQDDFHNYSKSSLNTMKLWSESQEVTEEIKMIDSQEGISHYVNSNSIYNELVFNHVIKGTCFEIYKNNISSLNNEYATAKDINTDIDLITGFSVDKKFEEVLKDPLDSSTSYIPLCDKVLFQSYMDRYLKTLELTYSCPNDINSTNYMNDNIHKSFNIFSFAYLSKIPNSWDTIGINRFLDVYMEDECIETYEYYRELEFCIHGKLIHSVFNKFPVVLAEDDNLGIILITRYLPIKINMFYKDEIYKFLDLLLTNVKCNKLGEIISNMISH